jgi:hypothetical protein
LNLSWYRAARYNKYCIFLFPNDAAYVKLQNQAIAVP